MKEKISITLEANLLRQVEALVDGIYIKNRSHAIEYLVRKWAGTKRTAVVLCGGPSERLELAKGIYRPTARLNGKCLIEHTLMKLASQGFSEVLIIGRKPVLTAVFEVVGSGKNYGVSVEYVEETHSRGSADSLRLAKERLNATFLVVFCDIFIDRIRLDELWESHVKNDYIATLMLTTTTQPQRKGIVKLEGSRVMEFVQKPSQTDTLLGFSSLFVAEPALLGLEGDRLEEDIFPLLAKSGSLGGHVSSEKEGHIHSLLDLKRLVAGLREG